MSNHNTQYDFNIEYRRIFGLAIANQNFFDDLMDALDDADSNSTDLKSCLTNYNATLQLDTDKIDDIQDYLNERHTLASQLKSDCESFRSQVRVFDDESPPVIQAC